MNVLIYNPIDRLKPIGGPSGYLFNLQSGLEELSASDRVDFLPPYHRDAMSWIKKRVWDSAPSFLRNPYYTRKHKHSYRSLLTSQSSSAFQIAKYDCVHFHSTVSMFQCRMALEDYDGTVVLTSHSPCVNHIELFTQISDEFGEDFALSCGNLSKIDEYAFSRADILVFPTEYAMEPYANTWPSFKKIIEHTKLMFMLSGTAKPRPKLPREAIRRRYGISDSAFVVSYVGRHNQIKGYDLLKEAASSILSSRTDIVFLIGGKEGPISKLENSRWIEVGWTDDPHSLMQASDLFVLPNRETYFDLVLLEALSLGLPVLATSTGGNRWFEGHEGVVLTECTPLAIERTIARLANLGKQSMRKMGISNLALYEREFTTKAFAARYLNLLEEIEANNA